MTEKKNILKELGEEELLLPELLNAALGANERIKYYFTLLQTAQSRRHRPDRCAYAGAPVTMPGVMETLLNVGLNRETLQRMMFLTGNPRFSWDCYRRLMENFGELVFLHDAGQYRSLLKDIMKKNGVLDEVELESSSLKLLAEEYELE